MYGAMLPLSSSRPSIPPSRGHACDEEKWKKVELHAKRPVEPVQLIPPAPPEHHVYTRPRTSSILRMQHH